MLKFFANKEFWMRLLLVLSPLLLLGLIELALVAADRSDPPLDAGDLKARAMMKSGRGIQRNGLALFSPSQDPDFRINSEGFRTHEFGSGGEDAVRIMLLGGSTAFGYGVSDRHSIHTYLEDILAERSEKPVRVFNLGVPGLEFEGENRVLELYGQQVRPDVVVFYHGANDGLAWFQQTVGRRESKQTLTPPLFSVATLLHLAYRSRLFALAADATRPDGASPGPARVDVSAAVKDYMARFAESRRLCAALKCMYVIQPVIFDKANRTAREIRLTRKAGRRYPLYRQMYAAYTDAILKASLADHHDARRALEQSDEDIFVDYVHVTGEGNRLMARFMPIPCAAGPTCHAS